MTWLEEERALREELRGDVHRIEKLMIEGFGNLRAELGSVKSDLMKWSFVFWVGAVTAIAALAGIFK